MVRLTVCRFSLLVALMGSLYPVCAQPNLRFHHLHFPQPFFSGITRDADGFAWISSKENLYRYDGKRTQAYGLSAGLKSRDIQSQVWQDEQKDLWFCTTEAIYCLPNSATSALRYPLHDADGREINEGYHLLHIDTARGFILTMVQQQLYAFHYRAARQHSATPSFTLLSRTDYAKIVVFRQSNGSVLYGDYSGGSPTFYQCQSDKTEGLRWVATALPHPMPDARYYHLIQGAENELWAATEQGLLHFHPNEGRYQWHFTTTPLRHLAYWPEGNIVWAATAGAGLWPFDANSSTWGKPYTHQVSDPFSIMDNHIQEVWVDHESNLWLSMWTKGVDHTNLKKLKFQTLPISAETDADFVPEHLGEDGDGNLWIASRKSGLLVLDQQGGLRRPAPSATHVIQTHYDPAHHTTLIATFGPLLQYNHRDGAVRPVLDQRSGHPLKAAFMLAHQNRILAGKTFENGCWTLEFKGKTWTGASIENETARQGLWGMLYKDESGRIWADRWGSGLVVFSDGNLAETIAEFPLTGEVKSFAEDKRQLWVAGDFGLLVVQKEHLTARLLNQNADQFPEMSVCAVVLDHREGKPGLWVSSGNGLFWYEPHHKTLKKFTAFDGVQGDSYSAGSQLQRRDGSIWIGGMNGLNYFPPGAAASTGIPARPYLQSILVNGQPATTTEGALHLKYFENNLEINLGIIEFADAEACKIFYQLSETNHLAVSGSADETGADPIVLAPDFRESTSGVIELEKLAPGNYTLTAIAMNSDGDLNWKEKIQVQIHIQAPFWQTLPFLALVVCALAGCFYLIYRRRLKIIQREERQKRALERQKADLEIKATRAQMNTHFIKNILSSIDAYILQADTLNASNYLVKCSGLMDKVLAYSVHPFITLEEELEFLEQYVELGAMGWRAQLHYEVIYDPNTIAPDHIVIPTMLLQPFVENALIHGLKNYPGEKRLAILITADKNKGIVCEIKNNGFSRQPAEATDAGRPHAIQIAKERLRLYDLKYHTHSSIDLQFLQGGVSVKINIGTTP